MILVRDLNRIQIFKVKKKKKKKQLIELSLIKLDSYQ